MWRIFTRKDAQKDDMIMLLQVLHVLFLGATKSYTLCRLVGLVVESEVHRNTSAYQQVMAKLVNNITFL